MLSRIVFKGQCKPPLQNMLFCLGRQKSKLWGSQVLALPNRHLPIEQPAVLPLWPFPLLPLWPSLLWGANPTAAALGISTPDTNTKEAALAETPPLYGAAQQKCWLLFYLWCHKTSMGKEAHVRARNWLYQMIGLAMVFVYLVSLQFLHRGPAPHGCLVCAPWGTGTAMERLWHHWWALQVIHCPKKRRISENTTMTWRSRRTV